MAIPTTSASQSLWLRTADDTAYPLVSAEENLTVDVAVIGGGIAGLTAALLLKRQGARVAVLEADRVGAGVTGCTTAKVSALQSTIYSTIRQRKGSAAAATYADATLAAVARLAALVTEEDIDCDVERRPAATYALTERERASIEQEYDAASQAGLPVTMRDTADLPFPTHGAVWLADQIALHPVRYLQGLARAVDGDGSYVFEQARAVSLSEGRPCTVDTTGGRVRADHVIVATHYPVFDRGGYFARLKPQRSYCIAAQLEAGARLPHAMSINPGSPSRSVRAYGDLLILGGEGHAAGSEQASPERFQRLEEFARTHWRVAQVTHRWSAQDPVPYDHLPMVGPYHPLSSRVWVATGFMKWGLTSATFAAMILTDLINRRPNEWASTFTPTRLSPRSSFESAEMGAKFLTDFVVDRVKPPQAWSPDRVPTGEARVVQDGLGKTGVYRDTDGGLHAVALRCTHLGCLLRFNAAETSWDCPCHGSRFDVDGNVLEGPATQALAKRHL
jgi:glycine/D-amino acid oxidase-like deaminating enzyme/nitrite reductase/ring-hydroxylating ferredoxin subunit